MGRGFVNEDDELIQGKWFVHIDRWHPARLNELLNAPHWSVRNRRKRFDADAIALAVLGAGVPKADRDHRRLVSLEITLAPRQRAGDPDCYWKSVLDGLVKCGALVNDSHIWCEVGSVTFRRSQTPATVIVLETLHKYARQESDDELRGKKRGFRVCVTDAGLVPDGVALAPRAAPDATGREAVR